jgi:hypothetical protein
METEKDQKYVPQDRLSKFLDDSEYNAKVTIAAYTNEYGKLVRIQSAYATINDNLGGHPELLPGLLLLRAHCSFLGAVRLGLSGMMAETYMLLRGCLESALYSFYIASNDDLQTTLLNRHIDADAYKKVRDEFSITKILKALKRRDPAIHGRADKLYDITIDYGGHPNERAITTQSEVTHDPVANEVTVRSQIFNAGDMPHELCLKNTARVGLCGLEILNLVFHDRFKELGLDTELLALRPGL